MVQLITNVGIIQQNGNYKVSSGYRMAIEDPPEEPELEDQEEDSGPSIVACNWESLWKTLVTPKIRYFL
ncbi:unnamed protein product [Linum trigynum]|uniref:Uncharacterized protein n=1 Tax=Linum trigynum TaxID=586398 RepID=A0AAV2EQJ7_9ROSI